MVLSALSQPPRPELERSYIWVDAICIDQVDDAERSQQVGIMDKIYKNAECVSVWIGLSPIPEVWSDTAAPLPGPIKTLDVEYLDWLDYISELANRPYWSRFWVIQEFLLGRDVEILCSNSRIHWSDFKDILSYCAGVELNGDVSQSDLLAARSTYAALPLITDRHPDRHSEFFQPLYDLLIQHRQSQCKDPRDRVFALLGLVNTDERRLLSRFFPNYNLSEEDVVIITLAHVTQLWNEHSVGLGSDDLFLGLGIAGRKRRKGLMKAANSIDYIGCESINEYMTAKELWSDLQDLDSLDPDVYDGAVVTRRPRVKLTGLGMLIGILAVSLGFVCRCSR